MSAAGGILGTLLALDPAKPGSERTVRYAVTWQTWRDTMTASCAFDDEPTARAERDRRQALELPESEGGAVWKILRIEELS